MASNPQYWPDGFGGTEGDDPLATAKDIYVYADASTEVRFVHSGTGNDANAGTRANPWASLHYALGQAGAGDVIVVMKGHTETFTSTRSVAARLIVIGEGVGDERPAITPSVPDVLPGVGANAITLTAPCHIRGLRFLASGIERVGLTIDASAAGALGTRLAYCDFVCGPNDQGNKVLLNAGGSTVDRCTFSSTATEYASRPMRALLGARLVRNCTFDGGEFGWQQAQAFLFGWGNSASGPVGIRGTSATSIIQCELSDGAYFDVTATPDYRIFPSGLGLIGHPLISGRGLYVSGGVTYVRSTTGTNAAGYGASPARPFATLKYAIATASATGLIVCLENHDETVASAAITIVASTIVAGAGMGDDRPRFARTGNINMLALSNSNGIGLLNLRFAPSLSSSSAARITVNNPGIFVDQCEVSAGANDVGYSLYANSGGDDLVISNTTFKAAGTAAAVPWYAIGSYSADNLVLDNCVFDGGEFGFAWGTCAFISWLEVFAENLSLLRGAQFVLDQVSYAVTIDAFVQVSLATGGAGVSSKVGL